MSSIAARSRGKAQQHQEDLPSDTWNPSNSEQRQIRNTLTLVASYTCRLSPTETELRKQFTSDTACNQVTIRTQNQTCATLHACFLARSVVLLSRYQTLVRENKSLASIDISDLNIDSAVLTSALQRLTALQPPPSNSLDLLSVFVACCKLKMDMDVKELLVLIRSDPGRLDITSLSVSDFTYILEMTTSNRSQAQTGLNKMKKDANITVDASSCAMEKKTNALGVKPRRRLSVMMQRKINKRLSK